MLNPIKCAIFATQKLKKKATSDKLRATMKIVIKHHNNKKNL